MTARLLTAVLAAVLAAVLVALAAGQERGARGPVVTNLTLFAGSEAGLWRTRDWGRTWEQVRGAALEQAGAVRAIVPLGPRVYLGADGGLFVSEDFGDTWTRAGLDGPVLAVLTSRYPGIDPTVFVGTPSGLLKSVDGGQRFVATPLQGTRVSRIEWPGPALIVATGQGVMVSTDAGASFSGPGSGLPEGEVGALALSSFYAVDPVLFAGVAPHGVFRSRDGGKTWTPVGLKDREVTDLIWFGPLLYAATDAGLFRSTDAGEVWEEFGQGLRPLRPERLMFPLAPDSGSEVFVSTNRGVYRSADGGLHWSPSGLGLEAIGCLATFPAPERTPGKRRSR